MREIKFRAFVDGKMVPVSIINNYRYCAVAEELDFDTMAGKVKLLEDYPVEIPVMQFTGLRDKHGKEIWEGDRVKCNNASGNIIFGTVEFIDGCFVVIFDEPQYDFLLKCYRKMDYVKCFTVNHALEVVGTIYEGVSK